MPHLRTCKICKKKTSSFTSCCEKCFQAAIQKAANKKPKKRVIPTDNSAKTRPFDDFDLFMICTDHYIGLTPRQMASLYDRDEKQIAVKLKKCFKNGLYIHYIKRWRLREAYDVYLEKDF